jgi:hypothetical protein
MRPSSIITGMCTMMQQLRQAIRAVAHDGVLLEQVGEDAFHAQALQLRKIDTHGLGVLGAVTAQEFGGNRLVVHHHPVNHFAPRLPQQDAHVVGKSEIERFARLGHQVGDVHARGVGFLDGLRNALDEQVGQHAGVKRARTQENQIRLRNRFEHFGKRAHAAGRQFDSANFGFAASGNARFSGDDRTIFHHRAQGNVGDSSRENPAARGQHLAA